RSEKSYTFPYPIFEEKVLDHIREINAADVLKRKQAGSSTVEQLRAKLANCRQDLANLKQDLKAAYSKSLAEVLREKEATEEQLVNQLQDELAKTARPLERAWKEIPSLIDLIRDADDPDAARLRVRPALRAVLDSGTVLIIRKGAWQILALQMNFVDGVTRHFLIIYRPAANQRPEIKDAKSFAEAGLTGALDLR